MTKEELIALAKKKGFESEFLYNKPYKYSNKEDLRWWFWLMELSRWLNVVHKKSIEYFYVEVAILKLLCEKHLNTLPDEK
jgi:hypothetical protein